VANWGPGAALPVAAGIGSEGDKPPAAGSRLDATARPDRHLGRGPCAARARSDAARGMPETETPASNSARAACPWRRGEAGKVVLLRWRAALRLLVAACVVGVVGGLLASA
jgi:hypothetical protein